MVDLAEIEGVRVVWSWGVVGGVRGVERMRTGCGVVHIFGGILDGVGNEGEGSILGCC